MAGPIYIISDLMRFGWWERCWRVSRVASLHCGQLLLSYLHGGSALHSVWFWPKGRILSKRNFFGRPRGRGLCLGVKKRSKMEGQLGLRVRDTFKTRKKLVRIFRNTLHVADFFVYLPLTRVWSHVVGSKYKPANLIQWSLWWLNFLRGFVELTNFIIFYVGNFYC